mgnify:CR=1 FL=1|jgi:DNA-binding NarL/FixJ family response regulator
MIFLIADDNDAKANWLEAMVEKSGIAEAVIRARTTEEAKELIDSRKPEGAFIDYEMPSEDGPAVIAYLLTNVPSAKVAMVSSSNSSEYHADAEAAGALSYICTSFEEEDVVEKVMDTLEEWKL